MPERVPQAFRGGETINYCWRIHWNWICSLVQMNDANASAHHKRVNLLASFVWVVWTKISAITCLPWRHERALLRMGRLHGANLPQILNQAWRHKGADLHFLCNVAPSYYKLVCNSYEPVLLRWVLLLADGFPAIVCSWIRLHCCRVHLSPGSEKVERHAKNEDGKCNFSLNIDLGKRYTILLCGVSTFGGDLQEWEVVNWVLFLLCELYLHCVFLFQHNWCIVSILLENDEVSTTKSKL